MPRTIYTPTEKQRACWDAMTPQATPPDEFFKEQCATSRRKTPWGIRKRDWMLAALNTHPDYHRGIWQGRLDAANHLAYSEERNDSAYNLGYYRGYTNYASDVRGWDAETRRAFLAQVTPQEDQPHV